jgi:hypothetical protein
MQKQARGVPERSSLRNRRCIRQSGARTKGVWQEVESHGVNRRSLRPLLAVLVTLLAAAVPAAAAAATAFYVSPRGNDSSSGQSPSRAWRTLYRVNKAHLTPGDVVLFEAGASFGDEALMPGWGTAVSGTKGAPVVFGSYGSGRATLTRGIWLEGEKHLVFRDFNLGAPQGIEGTGSDDVIANCSMSNFMSGSEVAINVRGSHWVIRGNTIDRTGDSGMLLRGDHFLVIGNTITNTGLDPRVTWGAHGIYLKASDSSVIANTIAHFHNNGVSVRYPHSLIEDNTISGGQFGIAWFQYESRRGTSRWIGNSILHTKIAAIYVSPRDIGGATNENFVISANKIYRPGGRAARVARAGGWMALSLSHNRGRYRIHGNHVV